MEKRTLTLPFTDETIDGLHAGDIIHMNGIIYTARDAAHKRLLQDLAQGKPPPIPLSGQIIYYVGPAPAKGEQIIGPAGPTTSGRMDPYTLPLLKLGVKGFIGKGYRSAEIKAALVHHRAIYMGAIGGAAALLARQVRNSRVVAYHDLGTEAIHELHVEEFPVIVVHDIFGGDAYEMGRTRYEVSK